MAPMAWTVAVCALSSVNYKAARPLALGSDPMSHATFRYRRAGMVGVSFDMPLSSSYRVRADALKAEAVREIGVLLVAFSPLDAAFAPFGARTLLVGLIFLIGGLLLFGIGLKMERRVVHD
jgi:hypothetical protein